MTRPDPASARIRSATGRSSLRDLGQVRLEQHTDRVGPSSTLRRGLGQVLHRVGPLPVRPRSRRRSPHLVGEVAQRRPRHASSAAESSVDTLPGGAPTARSRSRANAIASRSRSSQHQFVARPDGDESITHRRRRRRPAAVRAADPAAPPPTTYSAIWSGETAVPVATAVPRRRLICGRGESRHRRRPTQRPGQHPDPHVTASSLSIKAPWRSP